MRELMLAVALQPLMGWKFLRAQAIKPAVACHSLAQRTSTHTSDAWLAGLVSHLGMVEALCQLQGFEASSQGPHSLQFVQQMSKRARQLSYHIARAWQLPDTVQRAIREQFATRNAVTMSLVGKALSLGDSIAMLHTLVRAGAAHSPGVRLSVVAQQKYAQAKYAYATLNRWVD